MIFQFCKKVAAGFNGHIDNLRDIFFVDGNGEGGGIEAVPVAVWAKLEAVFVGFKFVHSLHPLEHSFPVELPENSSQTAAGLAGAARAVERKKLRFNIWQANSAVDAGIFFAESQSFAVSLSVDDTAAEFERGFQRIGKARTNPVAYNQPVYDEFNVMLFGFGELNFLVEFAEYAVNLHAHEAGIFQPVESFLVRTFLLRHNRRKECKARAFGKF